METTQLFVTRLKICNVSQKDWRNLRGSCRGKVANMLDCELQVSKFKL